VKIGDFKNQILLFDTYVTHYHQKPWLTGHNKES
jgi:hypothetical protein